DLPYIYMETEYLTRDKKYGRVKSLAFSILGNSFFCFHDELGYKQTFLRVISSLVQSDFIREFKEKFSNYHEKQIDLIYLNGVSVGFFENYEYNDDKNNRSLLTISSLIMPGNNSDLIGMGTFTNVSVDQQSGEVLSEKHYSYINNKVNHELQLDRTGENQYRIKGNHSGKEVNNTFKTAKPLLSSTVLIKDFNKTKEQNEIYFEEYSPISPLGASTGRIISKGIKGDGTTHLKYTIHSQTYDFFMDKNGYRSFKMSMGPVFMTLKRSFYDRR
ncbi:MAG: hypothetical protein OEZ34_15490, partial [Spirochaetia bacterium]|nr:hypothetical protein [Spirochaetia bacterium]